MLNIGLDLGNSRTKVVTEGKKFDFPSLIQDGYDNFSEMKRIKVEYENSSYGVGVGQNNINKGKYINDKYKIMFLTAIAKASDNEDVNIEANVVIGLPVSDYKNDTLKERVIEHINSWGTSVIKVDGLEKNIKINKLDIWVEGGIMVSDTSKYKNDKIIVVDIGGYTRDSIEFIYNEVGKNKTEENGILTLKEHIYTLFKDDFKSELDEIGKEELFEKTKKNKTFFVNNQNVDLSKYRKIIRNYASNIFDSLETTYTLADKKVKFIGGGSIELKPFLEEYSDFYNFEILEDANFINAQAYFDYAKKLL